MAKAISITSKTRVFALLGDPVRHSLSPVVQNAAFLEAGVDGVYIALRSLAEDLPGFIRGICRGGGGGNVTLPHKERAVTVLDVPSDAVRRTGACNTFWGSDGKIHGDNTDVEGFRRAFRSFVGSPSSGMRVLLLGAGGAARACLAGLMDEGIREVLLWNRTAERARAVARRIGGERARVITRPEDVRGEEFDLVLNATRLGLEEDEPLPFDLELPRRVDAVMDLVYGERPTSFVLKARRIGIRAADGGDMLVQQGAVAFERWWGVPAPVEVMKTKMRVARNH